MADKQWLFSPTPTTLNDYWWYHKDLSERKRYLFLAAAGHLVVPLMTEPACIQVIRACEEYADGKLELAEWWELNEAACSARSRCDSLIAATQAAHDFVTFLTDDGKLNECVEAASCAMGYSAATRSGELEPDTLVPAWEALERCPSFGTGCDCYDRELVPRCLDIFSPNPYSLPDFSSAWRSDTAVSLAKGMYESRDFSAMPILADALQDAGCDNDDILNHCRDEKQVHVRGCWVVDGVLGKA